MAFSTPAQKPRGEAKRTRSTGTFPGYRASGGGLTRSEAGRASATK